MAPVTSRWLLAASLLFGATACAPRAVQTPRPAPASPAAGAMRVYRDPSTGAFVEPPPGVAAPGPQRAPAAALTEQAAPGGGQMIRLRGAFRSQMVGRRDASGAAVSCATTAGAPRDLPPQAP
jgi:hypothetical protein